MTRGPSVKAAVTWAAAALHVLQAVDKVLGLHLVPQPVGDTRPQFCMLTHGSRVFVLQDDLLSLGPQLVQSQHPLDENHPCVHEMCIRGYWGAL